MIGSIFALIIIKVFKTIGFDDGKCTKEQVGEVHFDAYVTMSGIPRHGCKPTCELQSVSRTMYIEREKLAFAIQFDLPQIVSTVNQGLNTLSIDHFPQREVDDLIKSQCLG